MHTLKYLNVTLGHWDIVTFWGLAASSGLPVEYSDLPIA